MRRFFVLATLFTIGLIVASCSASSANIKSAQLAKGFQDGKVIDAATTFSPSDTPIHCVVQVANAPEGTKVKTVWVAVDTTDAAGATYKDQKIDEKELTVSDTSSTADFTLINNAAWPTGKYKVDIYLDDNLDRTLEFQVQ